MIEWTDDLGLFILKGYGNSLNHCMGVPLLEDVVRSMEQAIQSKEEFQQIQIPPKPPQRRNWKGSIVASFASTDMLATNTSSKYFVQELHNEQLSLLTVWLFVSLILLPGCECDGSEFCPFEILRTNVILSNASLVRLIVSCLGCSSLKNDCTMLCTVKLDKQEAKTATSLTFMIFSHESHDQLCLMYIAEFFV
ncbi:uncharacterized protein LOC21390356 [Morus notabilis]|nr:uncharacterized protein LOC21390356 [Morus notabilis]